AHFPIGAGVDVLGEHIGVLTLVTTGGDHRTVGPVVVVPAGNGADRHDRLQPGHSGGGHRVRQGPVVGDPHHPDLARRPVGAHRFARSVPPGRARIEPVHHRLRAQRFVLAAARRATGGLTGAQRFGVNDRVSPGQQVFLVVPGDFRGQRGPTARSRAPAAARPSGIRHVQLGVDVVVLHLVATGEVRADLVHDWDPQPPLGLLRTDYLDVHLVRPTVAVAVHRGGDEQVFPDD